MRILRTGGIRARSRKLLLVAVATSALAAPVAPGAVQSAFPLQRAGVGSERTTGGGFIAGQPFVTRSSVVVWSRKWNSLTLYFLRQKNVNCKNVLRVAGLPGPVIQVSITNKPHIIAVTRPVAILGTIFVVIPRDPAAPQQASGLKFGPTLTLTRVDTHPQGVWHGRFIVPRRAYGDGKIYAYHGTFAAKWCQFRT